MIITVNNYNNSKNQQLFWTVPSRLHPFFTFNASTTTALTYNVINVRRFINRYLPFTFSLYRRSRKEFRLTNNRRHTVLAGLFIDILFEVIVIISKSLWFCLMFLEGNSTRPVFVFIFAVVFCSWFNKLLAALLVWFANW